MHHLNNASSMAKDDLAPFGVSLSRSLLKELDRMIRKKGYRNRSQALSDMVRDHLIEHQRELGDNEVAGTITLVYDHHRPHVRDDIDELAASTSGYHDFKPPRTP
jgi:CopG family nickel-responsive transcriptional regulator